MKNLIVGTLIVAVLVVWLGVMVWIMTNYGLWLILGCAALVVGNMGVEKVTGKKTKLGKWIERS